MFAFTDKNPSVHVATQDDDADKEDALEEEEEDSFVVEDGYLSENEGVEVDDMGDSSDGDEGTAARQATPNASLLQQRLQLESLLEQSRRSTRPLYIATLPSTELPLDGDVPGVPHGWTAGDVSLLDCLSMVLLDSGRVLTAPMGAPLPARATPRATPTGRGAEPSAAHVEQLRAFLRQRAHDPEPLKKIATLVDAFIEAHPDVRVTKKWVTNMVRSMAQYVHGAGWKLLEGEGTPVASMPSMPAATPSAAAPAVEEYATPHPVVTLERFFGKVLLLMSGVLLFIPK